MNIREWRGFIQIEKWASTDIGKMLLEKITDELGDEASIAEVAAIMKMIPVLRKEIEPRFLAQLRSDGWMNPDQAARYIETQKERIQEDRRMWHEALSLTVERVKSKLTQDDTELLSDLNRMMNQLDPE
jgi:hypothetical protein